MSRSRGKVLVTMAAFAFYLIAKLALQWSYQFIRVVRNLRRHPLPWNRALPLFKFRLAAYI